MRYAYSEPTLEEEQRWFDERIAVLEHRFKALETQTYAKGVVNDSIRRNLTFIDNRIYRCNEDWYERSTTCDGDVGPGSYLPPKNN